MDGLARHPLKSALALLASTREHHEQLCALPFLTRHARTGPSFPMLELGFQVECTVVMEGHVVLAMVPHTCTPPHSSHKATAAIMQQAERRRHARNTDLV